MRQQRDGRLDYGKEYCVWTYDEQYDKWDTDCGEAHCLIDGNPEKNKMKFCCYCGRKLKEKKGKA